MITVTVAAGLFATSALAFTDKPAAEAPPKAAKFEKRYHHGCRHGGRHHDRGGDVEILGLRY